MRAIFFDLDGTLSDPFEGIGRSVRFAFESLGIAAPTDDEIRALVGPPMHVSMRERFGEGALAEEVLRLFRVRFGDVGLFETVVYPGISDLLRELRGRVPLFVCTTKPFVYAVRVLERLGFEATFDAVYGSELDGTRADKRELLAYALAEQGLAPSPSIALLGDRALDVAAARANGIAAWAAGWGYGSREELASADHWFACPAEVTAVIGR